MSQYSTSQIAPRSSAPRTLSPAQKAVLPMTPLFNACRAKGLSINEGNRLSRLSAINRYFYEGGLDQFAWLVTSFKELLTDRAALIVVVDAIEAGVICW